MATEITTKDILERGYFPKELPPPFTTKSFADNYSKLGETKEKKSLCLHYSYSKYATVRRTLSIPNPAHIRPLAEAVSEYWSKISEHCQQSELSRTIPIVDEKKERALTGKHSLDELPAVRAEIRIGARYILKADVTNFYGSLYTHAIPWAFHTKQKAKKNQGKLTPEFFGNILDKASRNIQSKQTMGIPIGPDTSFAIAESVLCSVDDLISKRIKISNRIKSSINGLRFVDDYEFACTTFDEAEEVRAIVQDSLAEFELQLNPRKTYIIELPDVLDTPWVHDLAAFNFETDNKKLQFLESQILRYFSRAFELVRANPGEPILKYAVRRFSEFTDEQFSHVATLLPQLLFQAATVDPGTLHTALHIVYKYNNNELDATNKETLTRALSSIIQRHAPLQHSGDVAWALWGAIVFKVSLDDMVVDALNHLRDPIAALMALHADDDGRLKKPLTQKVEWEKEATSAELFDSRWLLFYEGVGKDWLKPLAEDPAATDSFFAAARSNNISFYDEKCSDEIPKPSPAGNYPL